MISAKEAAASTKIKKVDWVIVENAIQNAKEDGFYDCEITVDLDFVNEVEKELVKLEYRVDRYSEPTLPYKILKISWEHFK